MFSTFELAESCLMYVYTWRIKFGGPHSVGGTSCGDAWWCLLPRPFFKRKTAATLTSSRLFWYSYTRAYTRARTEPVLSLFYFLINFVLSPFELTDFFVWLTCSCQESYQERWPDIVRGTAGCCERWWVLCVLRCLSWGRIFRWAMIYSSDEARVFLLRFASYGVRIWVTCCSVTSEQYSSPNTVIRKVSYCVWKLVLYKE